MLKYRMPLFNAILDFHIIMGSTGLMLGPVAMLSPKRKGWHTRVGELYHGIMLFMCLSAAGLAVLHWNESKWFLAVAAFSYGFAFRGYWAAKRRYPNWIRNHVSGMLGSYIAMVTALLVVNRAAIPGLNLLPVWVTWILPTLIGSPIIAFVQIRLAKTN